MPRHLGAFTALAALSLSSSLALAQRIDPQIARPRTLPERPVGARRYPLPARGTPVLVELRPDAVRASPDPRAELESLPDVEVLMTHAQFALVRVGTAGISSLAGSRLVLRAIDARTSSPMPALDRSRALLELDAAWGRASVGGGPRDRFTGEGVTIADIDTALDVFHPAFFRGDAGWFDWIDVDSDGVMTPGRDAIDLDGDGVAGPGETARVLSATPIDLTTVMPAAGARPTGFHPGLDWLYLDQDGDGARGTALSLSGVTEETPAYGEPVFTPDDLDRDGVLGLHERVVRLGSSKLARVWIDLQGPTPLRRELVRGVDLHQARRDYTGGVYGYADTLHGSGVAGILAGDLPLLGRRWVGIAPDAELLSAFYWGDTQAAPVMWALAQGADVVLHEYVSWTREALDGGDVLGVLIDDSTADGAVHVCPAGNIGGARKHTHRSVSAGTVSLPIEVPADVGYWEASVYAPSGLVTGASLRVPSGETVEAVPGTVVALPHGDLYGGQTSTLRGREIVTVAIVSNDGSPVAAGAHTLVLSTSGAGEIDAFVSDASSGFALGVAFPAEIATDAGTISWPATSDACTAVGAIPAYISSDGAWIHGSTERAGEVRDYSSRGPRIDGDLRVHVVAPDNPWSVLGAGEVFPMYPGDYVMPEGAYQIFGGTSGAGPHVAGVAALLVEAGLRGPDVRSRIMETAIDDGFGPLPNGDYGAGRLDALRALAGGASDDAGVVPVVSVSLSAPRVAPGESVRVVVTASDPGGGPISLRWDDDYDGSWDSEYAAYDEARERTITPRLTGSASEGWGHVKVRVRNVAGLLAEASVRVRVGEWPAGTDASVDSDAGVDADAGVGGMPGDGGGCGCRAPATGTRSTSAWLLGLGLLTAGAARRRRAQRSAA